MKLTLFFALLSLSSFNELKFVNGNRDDPNAPAYTTLLDELSKKIQNEKLLNSLKSVIKLSKAVLSTAESSEWLDVHFIDGQPSMNEIRENDSRAKDWVNLMTSHNGNVEFVLKGMISSRDELRRETNANIDRLTSDRTTINENVKQIHKLIVSQPKIKHIDGFEAALAQFDDKQIDAKHLNKIEKHLSLMQNNYNQMMSRLSEKVPASVTIRKQYLSICDVQNLNKCRGNQSLLRDVITSLLQKQNALKTVLGEIFTILKDYNTQRLKLAETITGFSIKKLE